MKTTRHLPNEIHCLIYALRNRVNEKVYVGQTWRSLKQRMNTGYEGCWHLQNAINLYGLDQFYYEVLTIANTQEQANYWECYFIEKFETLNEHKGYNLKEGGSRGRPALSSRQKMSQSRTGLKRTEEQKLNCSIAKMGSKNPACKITAELARQIYIDYHTNLKETCDTLADKYELDRSNVNNITKGTAWQNETKDLIGLTIRKGNGKTFIKTKLTEKEVIEIKQKFATKLHTFAELGREYGVLGETISLIIRGKTWKHII